MTSWPCSVYICGWFLKWWYPTTMGFPTKNDHFGVSWGYHHWMKHPYIYIAIDYWLLHCGIFFSGWSWPPPRINAAHDQLRVWGSQELHAVGIYWTWNACFLRRQKMMERLCYGCDACKTGCSFSRVCFWFLDGYGWLVVKGYERDYHLGINILQA